ncbi:NADP-dependent oxidoreductase [Bradyrhizobium sp. B120]|uniref:NADP-dependent oxidoreductase n=1 Tax=Bradyrhizobium sp. B120 TaxID=3410088 RepID=UPI003B9830C0
MREFELPGLQEGEVLVKNRFLSLDPYMRGQMDGGESYIQAINPGEVMNGHTIGEIVDSKDPRFAVGELVWGPGHWQDFVALKSPPVRKIDPKLAPLPAWLGPMGLPGWTAYVGLLDLANPTPGETVVVSSAAGAVGALTGQIANMKGLRAIGIAGGPDKCRYAVEELGYAACVDYKASDFRDALAAACPNGIDIDFENVGGEILDAIWPLLNRGARVIICGLMAQYNLTKPHAGPDLTVALKKRLNIRGFIIADHFPRLPAAIGEMAGWLGEGKIKYKVDVSAGLENSPDAFIGMLQGKNFGKTIVQIS